MIQINSWWLTVGDMSSNLKRCTLWPIVIAASFIFFIHHKIFIEIKFKSGVRKIVWALLGGGQAHKA